MRSDDTGIFPAVKRIYAIADVHGDYESTLDALKLCGVIKLSGTRWIWSGTPGTFVVQLGDQIDRKSRDETGGDEDSEFRIMKLFDFLDCQAKRVGCRVLSLVGNHEMMNVKGQFSYVSKKGLAHFGGADKRLAAFRPGGEMAIYMAENRYAVLKIGKFVFVHGGVIPKIAEKYDIPTVNKYLKDYLTGKLSWNRDLHTLFEADDSLLWSRNLAGPRPNCTNLKQVLDAWKCKAVIIGHTPQEDGITSACEERVWRVDVGLSAAIMGSKGKAERVQVLEIAQLSGDRARMTPLSAADKISKPKKTATRSKIRLSRAPVSTTANTVLPKSKGTMSTATHTSAPGLH